MSFTLAIVGRPNVGKSTLFNRLAGKELAITHNTPGLTRDWREAEGFLFGETFRVIDTAGLEESFDDSIQGRMRKQTENALKQADVILFVIDGRQGVTPMDKHFADFLRRQNKPVLLGVNKCENERVVQSSLAESYELGLGDPIPLSAAHGDGMSDLFDLLKPYFREDPEEEEQTEEEKVEFDRLDDIEGDENFEFSQEQDDPAKPIKIAIAGRPNVGKSTLLNTILQDDRVMTGPEAGITRDAIAVDWEYQGRKFKLVDTAGLRRKARVVDAIEKMSVEDTLRAIRLAQVVILVIDGLELLEKQDLQIADHIIDEGRALVIAVNKWDAVENKPEVLQKIKDRLQTSLAQLKDIPFVTMSALNGKNIDLLLETTMKTYETWNKRIGTGGLNRWLRMMESRNPAPMANGRPNRVKYMTQIKTRPPTFAVWASKPMDIPDSYKRYIVNGLREDYDIPGVPVRITFRASKNPYAEN